LIVEKNGRLRPSVFFCEKAVSGAMREIDCVVGGAEDGENSGGICVVARLVRKVVAGVDGRDVERKEM